MKSVLIVSVLSFFVIFAGTFWFMGVFEGGSKPDEESIAEDETAELGVVEQGMKEHGQIVVKMEVVPEEIFWILPICYFKMVILVK